MKRILALCLVLVLFFVALPVHAHASGDIIAPEKFNKFDSHSGDAQYLSQRYRDNYYLDVEKLGILDAGESVLNSVANVLFSFVHILVYITVTLFYYAMSLDLGAIFETAINGIQAELVDSIFKTLFFFAVAASFVQMGRQLYRQNLQEILGEFLRIFIIMALATGITLYSGQFLTTVNTMTKGVSISALGGLSGAGDSTAELEDYAADAAGMLWGNMLHRPWMSLEFYNFGNSSYAPKESDIDALLSNPVNSSGRQEAVKKLNSQYGLFDKEVSGYRIGFCLLLLLLIMLKSAIFLCIAALQLGFQVLTLFAMLICPLVLLLSLVPQLGGMDVLAGWLKKLLEIQLSIVILSFVIGFIIKVDEFLLAFTPQFGWLIVLVLQGITLASIIFFRKRIMGMLSIATRGMQRPVMMRRQLERATNMYEMMGYSPTLGIAAHRRHRPKPSNVKAKPKGERVTAGQYLTYTKDTDPALLGLDGKYYGPGRSQMPGNQAPTPAPAPRPQNKIQESAARPKTAKTTGERQAYNTGANNSKLQHVQYEPIKATYIQQDMEPAAPVQEAKPGRAGAGRPGKQTPAAGKEETIRISIQGTPGHAPGYEGARGKQENQRPTTARPQKPAETWLEQEMQGEREVTRRISAIRDTIAQLELQRVGGVEARLSIQRPATAAPASKQATKSSQARAGTAAAGSGKKEKAPQQKESAANTSRPPRRQPSNRTVSTAQMMGEYTAYIPVSSEASKNASVQAPSYAVESSTTGKKGNPPKQAKNAPGGQNNMSGQSPARHSLKDMVKKEIQDKKAQAKLEASSWLAAEMQAETQQREKERIERANEYIQKDE